MRPDLVAQQEKEKSEAKIKEINDKLTLHREEIERLQQDLVTYRNQ